MVLVIDASNIRGGGGVTHLVELLKASDPVKHGFNKVYLCSGQATLNRIEEQTWLVKYYQPILDRGLIHRVLWQFLDLGKLLKKVQCDLLFVPGGTYFGNFRPFATMSQNLLPFEFKELGRYGFSKMALKLLILRFTQSITFKKSNGIIFLTNFSKAVVMKVAGLKSGVFATIPHGINQHFERIPKRQKPIDEYSIENPYRILYVSSVDVYKHQWHVINAISLLRDRKFPVTLDLVGPAEPSPLQKLKKSMHESDPDGLYIFYHGPLPYQVLNEIYAKADLGLFASSCETFGQIVTEAMSAGLPLACSRLSAMPEVLGDAGLYFHPEKPEEIASAIQSLIESPTMREKKAEEGFIRSKSYSWYRAGTDTFDFLAKVSQIYYETREKKYPLG